MSIPSIYVTSIFCDDLTCDVIEPFLVYVMLGVITLRTYTKAPTHLSFMIPNTTHYKASQ